MSTPRVRPRKAAWAKGGRRRNTVTVTEGAALGGRNNILPTVVIRGVLF